MLLSLSSAAIKPLCPPFAPRGCMVSPSARDAEYRTAFPLPTVLLPLLQSFVPPDSAQLIGTFCLPPSHLALPKMFLIFPCNLTLPSLSLSQDPISVNFDPLTWSHLTKQLYSNFCGVIHRSCIAVFHIRTCALPNSFYLQAIPDLIPYNYLTSTQTYSDCCPVQWEAATASLYTCPEGLLLQSATQNISERALPCSSPFTQHCSHYHDSCSSHSPLQSPLSTPADAVQCGIRLTASHWWADGASVWTLLPFQHHAE